MHMKTTNLFVTGAVATLLPFAVALAQETTPPQPNPASPPTQTAPDQGAPDQHSPSSGQGASFESLDADGDGRISKAEAASNATVQDQFSRYDVNGDGFIERTEVQQANGSDAGGQSQQK
jgi:Ca2+-binding EF-hand superfamily protein